MEYAAIAAAIVGVISSLIGGGQEAEAAKLRQQMLDKFGPELLPHLERAEAEQLGRTELGGIKEDDSLRAQQIRAARQLEDVYQNDGLTDADKAALNRAQDVAGGQAASQYAGLQQSLAARGQAPTGALGVALASQVGQNATNASAKIAGDAQMQARARALQALEAGAGLAGKVRESDWEHNAARASAQDSINAFNMSARERAQYHNLGLSQQEFDNRMSQLVAQGNIANQVAGGYERGAQSTRDTGGGIANSLLTLGNYQTKKKKEDEP